MEMEGMITEPLISVIVPIYNVAPYVKKCLDSLQNQTMKEIEVICIDDGSTDRSGDIAEEYASSTVPIFRIIHTENRGLSAARNRGVDEARAPWLMFVDSDDWVDSRYCEIPFRSAIENEADLVIFGSYRTNYKGKIKREKKREVKSGIAAAEDVILNPVAWNKLYRDELFTEIRYPEGHVYEDIATTYKLIDKASKIYLCKENLYFYRKRTGSICYSNSNKRDAYSASRQRYKDLITMGYSEERLRISLQMTALSYCGNAANTDDPLYCEAVDTVKAIKGIPDGFSRKTIAKLIVWRINKRLYRSIYSIYGKRMKKVSTM